MNQYNTLAVESSATLIEKKSSFMGFGSPCATEEEARAFVERVRQTNPKANHVCYGFCLGDGVSRSSDDGEPKGTAGVPIIETMKQRGLTMCVVAVARVFGGVKLGTGPLARAYAKACSMAIDACGVATVEPIDTVTLALPYSLGDKAKHIISAMECKIVSEAYTDNVMIAIRAKQRDMDEILPRIIDMLNGKVEIVSRETMMGVYGDVRRALPS